MVRAASVAVSFYQMEHGFRATEDHPAVSGGVSSRGVSAERPVVSWLLSATSVLGAWLPGTGGIGSSGVMTRELNLGRPRRPMWSVISGP